MENKEKEEEKSTKKWWLESLAFLLILAIAGFILNETYYKPMDENIRSNGVYSICEITTLIDRGRRKNKPRYDATYTFTYNSKEYNFHVGRYDYDISQGDTLWSRRIVAFLPSDPEEDNTMMSNRVQDWFTLDAPDEGWAKEPTDNELRAMQNQADSLRRLTIISLSDTISKNGK